MSYENPPSNAKGSRVMLRMLEAMGVPRDGLLLVHSAFKVFSRNGYDAGVVLRTLVEYMKPGTLLLPTMSWRFVDPANPVFDELRTPSNAGILTEMFRREYATGRSLHPTHSVAGRGLLVEELLGSHHLGITPCSGHSPFGKLAAHGGWIIMLGVGMDCCTLVHHVEESVAPHIYCRPASEMESYTCRDRNGKEIQVRLRRHRFLRRDFWQFQDTLAASNRLQVVSCDTSVCLGFKAADMIRVVCERLAENPAGVLAVPGQRYRRM